MSVQESETITRASSRPASPGLMSLLGGETVYRDLPVRVPQRFESAARGPSALNRRKFARSAATWPTRAWCALDAALAYAIFASAHVLSPQFTFGRQDLYDVSLGGLVYATLLVTISYALGLYDRHTLTMRWKIVSLALGAAVLAGALTTLAFSWFGLVSIGRYVVLIGFLLTLGYLTATRLAARSLAGYAKARVLLIGSRCRLRPLERELRTSFRRFYEQPLVLDPESQIDDLGAALEDVVERYQPEEVVVEDQDRTIATLLQRAPTIAAAGCRVFASSAYYEGLTGRIAVETLDHRGIFGKGFRVGHCEGEVAKRLLDIALASIGLIVAAPVAVLVAGLVALTKGPILYHQVRVGRYGRPFKIYKFRTMRTDAEKNGAVWAVQGDTRVTRVGRLLRKSRLDELPQLWNILRGDMSFVGPRPERPEFVSQLSRDVPHYDIRHLVRPGLTGWAQVRFPYGSTVCDAQKKLAYDLYYVRHYGVLFDLAVCLRTVAAMSKGAR